MSYPKLPFLVLAVLQTLTLSCTSDRRPLDTRLREAVAERLNQYDVRGAVYIHNIDHDKPAA